MRHISLLAPLVGLMLAVAPSGRAAQQVTLTGVYACKGINPDGTPYSGVLEVIQQGDIVHARWRFPSSPPTHGLGLVRQDVLAISYFGPQIVGIVMYRIEKGAITIGEWVTVGADGVHRETLEKMPDAKPSHDFAEPKRPVRNPAGTILG